MAHRTLVHRHRGQAGQSHLLLLGFMVDSKVNQKKPKSQQIREKRKAHSR